MEEQKTFKNYGEVDFEEHALEEKEEDCEKINKELEEKGIKII